MASSNWYKEASWDFVDLFHGIVKAPSYHLIFEVILILWIVRLLFTKSYKPVQKTELTEKEQDELIRDWVPEPLVPVTPEDDFGLVSFQNKHVGGHPGKIMSIDGKECLNFATMNFLNMVGNIDIEDSAIKTISKYGVGSCGPRGFYGTLDVHLEFENNLAEFFGCEQAALYSYNFASIASAIPSYSKRTDIIFCDEGSCFAIQKGLQASRSKIFLFKHNDMDDLESKLKKQEEEDIKNPKKARSIRRFLVVEGLYYNYGDICPLPKLIELKKRYKVRIFIDESCSFGVLGKTGRGVTEHFNIKVTDVDLISASAEYALGSIGGFCVGSKYVIDHQILSGAGYCYSASLPPLLAVAGRRALEIMEKNPDKIHELQKKCALFHEKLKSVPKVSLKQSSNLSPISHLYLNSSSGSREDDAKLLNKVVDKVFESTIVINVSHYLVKDELKLPEPSLRLVLNCAMTEDEMDKAVLAVQDACEELL